MSNLIRVRSPRPLRPPEALRILKERNDIKERVPPSLRPYSISPAPNIQCVTIRELILISGLMLPAEEVNALLAEINEPPLCIDDLGSPGGHVALESPLVVLKENGFTRALAQTVHGSLRKRGECVLAKSLFRADGKKGRLFHAIENRLGVRLPIGAEARKVVAARGLSINCLGFPIQNPSNPECITHFWNYQTNSPKRTVRPNDEDDLFGRLVVVLAPA